MPVSSSTMRILCMLCRDRGQRGLGNDRQFDDEARSDWLVFFHPNGSMVLFDDAAHDRQTKPGPAFSSGEIRQKKFFLQLPGNAMPGICDRDFHCVGLATSEVEIWISRTSESCK